MRRKEYEAVKRMDRQTFERFCQALYEDGQQSILNSRQSIDFEDVKAAILEVKGIGEKRADLIMEKLQERMDKKNNE